MDFLLLEISKLIELKLGILLTPDKFSLYEANLKRLSKLVNKISVEEYILFLKDTLIADELEWKIVIQALNISETYFFRDLGQIELIEKTILPEIIAKNRDSKTISIWSAGCSTGEEAYSMSILLRNLIPDFDSWNISIFGSDINSNSVEAANKGEYFDWSFRNITESYHQKYFTKQKDSFIINDILKKNISFKKENLISAVYLNKFDLILCRNVFIYLNDLTKEKIMINFSNSLKKDGYLVLGHSEAGRKIPSDIEVVVHKNSLYYRKRQIIAELVISSESKQLPPSRMIANPIFKLEATVSADLERKELLLAQEYANKGDFASAKNYCKAAISLSEKNFEAYYLLGLIYESEGRHSESILNYEKVIQINQNFLEAYLNLGSLYNLMGKQEFSAEIRRKGYLILNENKNIQKDYESKGFNIKSFISFFKNESAIWF